MKQPLSGLSANLTLVGEYAPIEFEGMLSDGRLIECRSRSFATVHVGATEKELYSEGLSIFGEKITDSTTKGGIICEDIHFASPNQFLSWIVKRTGLKKVVLDAVTKRRLKAFKS